MASDFIARWHAAVGARDVTLLSDIIADDCAFHSPVMWTAKTGRPVVLFVLASVIEVIADFRYREEWISADGRMVLLEFEGTVDGKSLVGIDRISLDGEGRMTRLEVWIRPLNALQLVGAKMGERLAALERQAG